MKNLLVVLITGFILFSTGLNAQNFIENGRVTGSFQFDGQYYAPDDKLGINDSTLDGKLFRMNGFEVLDMYLEYDNQYLFIVTR